MTLAVNEAKQPTAGMTDNPFVGILLICIAVIFLIVLEMCAKTAATNDIPVMQVSWIRFVGHLFFFAFIFGPKMKFELIRTDYVGVQILRGFLLLTMTLASFLSLKYLQMIEVTVIGFLIPLVVAALSVPMLGEKVGKHRWAAIVLGFVGILFVVRPTDVTTHWSMFVLMAAIFGYGFYLILTRKLAAKNENPVRSVFYTALIGGIVLTIPMPFIWVDPVSIELWAYLLAAGFFGGMGHFLLIKAHSFAGPSLLAPFLYTQIIWSSLAGYIQFGDVPDHWTMVGGAIVISSGLYLMAREAVKKREAVKLMRSQQT